MDDAHPDRHDRYEEALWTANNVLPFSRSNVPMPKVKPLRRDESDAGTSDRRKDE